MMKILSKSSNLWTRFRYVVNYNMPSRYFQTSSRFDSNIITKQHNHHDDDKDNLNLLLVRSTSDCIPSYDHDIIGSHYFSILSTDQNNNLLLKEPTLWFLYYVLTLQLMVCWGMSFIYVVGSFVDCRTLAVVATVPSLLQFPLLFFIPESPRWLAKVGRYKTFLFYSLGQPLWVGFQWTPSEKDGLILLQHVSRPMLMA